MAEYKCVPLTPDQSADPRVRARIIASYNAAGYDYLFTHKVQLQEAAGLMGKSYRVTDVETLLFVRDPAYDVDAVSAIDQLPTSELNGAAAAIDEAAAMIRAGVVPDAPPPAVDVPPAYPAGEKPAENVWSEAAPYVANYTLPYEADSASPQGGYVPPSEIVDDGDYSPQNGYGTMRVKQGRKMFVIGICMICAAVLGLILTFAIHASMQRPAPAPVEPEKSDEISAEPEVSKDTETTADGVKYAIQDGKATVTGYEKGFAFAHGGLVVVESKIENAEVTAIADGAFSGLNNVLFVSIPGSVTQIGNGVFSGSTVKYVLCSSGTTAQTYAGQNGLETILTNDLTPYDDLDYFPKELKNGTELYAVKASGGTLLKSGPGDSYKQTGAPASGSIYLPLASENGWYMVEFDGKFGWIKGGDLIPAQDYDGDTYTFATDYYALTLPVGWKNIVTIDDSDPKQVSFKNKRAADNGFGGHVFSILVTQTEDYKELPHYELLAAAYGYYYVIWYPTDVQIDTQDALSCAQYQYMGECVDKIRDSLQVKDTGVASMFDAHFKENPIDAACDAAMVDDPSTQGMVQAMAKYADFWKDEIDHAYKLLLDLKSGDSAAYTTVKTAQQAWQNSAADQLEKALDGINPEGTEAEQLNYAYTSYDFYQQKARSVYEEIYAVCPDYSYAYGGD